MSMPCLRIQLELDYALAIANSFLDLGDAYIFKGDAEAGLKCNYLAAHILCRQNRDLSCPRLESNLHRLAKVLPDETGGGLQAHNGRGSQQVWLHVFTAAYPEGGHTAMAIRWMKNDEARRIHNVALLSQSSQIPGDLLEACHETGGEVFVADPRDPFLRRAAWLRGLAYRCASHVVLHVNMDDVIAGVAFGIDGGPPVLLVNHAAHVFWVGASIADSVINCRGSKLETYWTKTLRGALRCSTIPIPLLEAASGCCGPLPSAEAKSKAKERLGLPKNKVLILTVGSAYKYVASNGLDFIATCEDILSSVPEAFVVAVGPKPNERWNLASERTGSRLRAVGILPRPEVSLYHQAADIFVEGFPFGTTTALLEAGLQGIAVVLAPTLCPPPYATDGVAVDDTLERPRTVEEFKAKVIHLIRNPAERCRCGATIRKSIIKHHTGAGWNKYFENAIGTLPREHKVHSSLSTVRTPEVIHEYWSEFVRQMDLGFRKVP